MSVPCLCYVSLSFLPFSSSLSLSYYFKSSFPIPSNNWKAASNWCYIAGCRDSLSFNVKEEEMRRRSGREQGEKERVISNRRPTERGFSSFSRGKIVFPWKSTFFLHTITIPFSPLFNFSSFSRSKNLRAKKGREDEVFPPALLSLTFFSFLFSSFAPSFLQSLRFPSCSLLLHPHWISPFSSFSFLFFCFSLKHTRKTNEKIAQED